MEVKDARREAVHVGRGKDTLGSFNVSDNVVCRTCGHVGLVISYREKPNLEDYVRNAPNLILRKHQRRIGLTCGCYAKLHRQIVHIRKNGKGNGK
jgi:hypothetical protein